MKNVQNKKTNKNSQRSTVKSVGLDKTSLDAFGCFLFSKRGGNMNMPYFNSNLDDANMEWAKACPDWKRFAGWFAIFMGCVITWLIVIMCIFFFAVGHADAGVVDLSVIAQIESSGNPLAFNKVNKEVGLYQVSPSCLADYNQFHAVKYSKQDLFNVNVNKTVAEWYLNTRIVQLLKHYGKQVNLENVIVAYNAGIGNVVKGRIPNESKNYIAKYRRLSK